MAYSTLLCAVGRKTLGCLTCIPHTNNVLEASPTVEKLVEVGENVCVVSPLASGLFAIPRGQVEIAWLFIII